MATIEEIADRNNGLPIAATIEYTIPIHIRAGLSIRLDEGTPLTREHIDAAMDSLTAEWQDAAIEAGAGNLYADALGPLFGDWRGETWNIDTDEEGEFDLRNVFELAAENMHTVSDWKSEVANDDTTLGYREWLQHQVESDEHAYSPGTKHGFHSSASTDHVERNGSTCEIVRALTQDEADVAEVGLMFKVRFDDGAEIDAFIDELMGA